MLVKSLSPRLRNAIGSFWFFANKFFFHLNISRFFKGCAVARQVTISDVKEVFHFTEINPVIHDKDRHDAQPYATFKFLIELIDIKHFH